MKLITLAGRLGWFVGVAAATFGQVPVSWTSRGFGGGGAFYSPSINPANDSEFYVASDMSGTYHTTNFGNSYSVVKFGQIQGGHDTAVRFTKDANIAYTVSYPGGNDGIPVKTTDGGATWQVLAGNPLPYDNVYSIWADYNQPNRVIVTGYADIYFSNDGGASFSHLNLTVDSGAGVLIGGVFFDGNNIYLGTSIGLVVSTNGGTSFSNAGLPGIPATEQLLSFAGAKANGQLRFFCLTIKAGDVYPGKDIGADYYAALKSIYSLDNASGNWTARMTGIDPANDFLMFVAMAANDINTVYAGGSNQASFGQVPEIMKTTDGGLHWANVFKAAGNQNIATGWSGRGGDRDWSYGEIVLGMTVAPSNSAKVLFTDLGFVHRTSDGGTTWQQAYVNPADQHAMNTTSIAGGSYHSIELENTSCWQVVWGDAQTLFAGFSDVRGTRSTDGGSTWSFKYTGHTANTLYRMVKHPTTGVIYGATSDVHDLYQSTRLANGTLDASDGGGKVISSSDNGATWQNLHTFNHPVFWVALDPNNTNRLYASVVHSTAGGVYVSQDIQNGASSTWTWLPNPPRTEGHPASLVVLNDGKLLCTYSGHRNPGFTASSGLFVYDPTANSWSDVSDPGMQYWTKDVVVDPADAAQNTWYVGVFSGWGGPPNGLGGLYRTTDRGKHWTRINALDRVTSITVNPVNTSDAFLTTETDGLWHTSNLRTASPSFELVGSYPFRQPERVFFNPYNSNEIWVTSFGDGLRVGTISGSVAAPVITQQPQSVTANVGQNVSFSVTATGSGLSYQWYLGTTAVSGGTGAALTLNNVQTGDAGNYSVTVSNGGGSVTSTTATLTVNATVAAPVITQQPQSASALTGQNISFTVTATGSGLSYQWYRGTTALSGATGATLTLNNLQTGDAGNYTVKVSNSGGNVTSVAATLTVSATVTVPVISQQPQSANVVVGQNVSFSVTATGTGLSYQWYRGTTALAGATGATLTLNNVQAVDAGTYSVKVSNTAGSITSNAVTLTVSATGTAPVITQQPTGLTLAVGQTATFTVTASGPSIAFQWYKGSTAISGATGATLTLANVQMADAGSYQVTLSNAYGTVRSNAVSFTVVAGVSSRLTNISTRANVDGGSSVMIAGFVIRGTGVKNVLIRASGPGLAQFGVSGALADPLLELHNSSALIAQNDDWSADAAKKTALLAAFQHAAAFAWVDGSKDAALLVTLAPGDYTAVVSGGGGSTGVALVELFDLDGAASTSRLVNISTRSAVRTDANVQIAGFAITGNTAKKVIVRATGPGLAKYGVSGWLLDPMLDLHDSVTSIATNDNWDAFSVRADFQRMGVDNWDVGSTDAALVSTLNPGGYTAIVSGKSSTTGVALIEVFDAD